MGEFEQIASMIDSLTVSAFLLYAWYSERKERLALQQKIIDVLQESQGRETAKLGMSETAQAKS